MSHPFGDLLSQHLHRRHGLSQAKLAAGILQDPSIISRMCRGERLTGPQARERVLAIISWLHEQDALATIAEANALLDEAGLAPLNARETHEATLLGQLQIGLTPRRFPRKRRTNLPAPLTSFIGRTRETSEVQQLIAAHRLVTLFGAGGVGKTRLALEAGVLVAKAEAQISADGVWLLELAALAEPRLIVHNALQLFNIADGGFTTPFDALVDYLAPREMVLIIDNCEHLVDGCAAFIEQLLQRCWQLRILATSREALRIPGEQLYPVTPLDVASVSGQLALTQPRASANQLFLERMHAAHAMRVQSETEPIDEEVVAHICRRLDGIPLALELAAPLTQSMSLAELAAQLDDQMRVLISRYRTVVPRHRTMYNALAWSYQLLGPDEQRLLARLSVFAGGWTLEAAHAISNGESLDKVRESNRRLIQNSLALVDKTDGATHNQSDDEQRFHLLEPIRQFANEQLLASGEADCVRQRHANYFLALAERLEETRDTPAVTIWLHRLQQDLENLRAANAWAIEQQNAAFAHQLNGALMALWNYSNDLAESNLWLQTAMALPAGNRSPAALRAEADALRGAGYAVCLEGKYELGETRFQRELALRLELGEEADIAGAWRGLGFSALMKGDLTMAQDYVEKGLHISRKVNDLVGIIWARHDLAHLSFQRRDFPAAEAQYEMVLDQLIEHGLPFGVYRATLFLGATKRELGKISEASALFSDGLQLKQRNYFVRWTAEGLEGLAGIAAHEEKAVRAAHLLAAAETHRIDTSSPRWGFLKTRHTEDLAFARSLVDEKTWNDAWRDGQDLETDEAVRYAIGNPIWRG